MRKLLYLVFLNVCLLLMGLSSYAQDRTINGKVSGEDNKPLPAVTVTVKGTQRKTITDANGNFTILAHPGDVLLFTSVGRKASESRVQNSTTVDLIMNSKDNVMSEVVVTAMDQRRNPRELGYSTQSVKGAEVAQTQRENFVNALQGRVAGLTITPTTGAAGASSGVVLRGYNTLSGTNQPLFVLDGIIVDNSTLNSNSQGGAGIGLASDLPNRNNDYTNRIADINPNDIEVITVLKGPEATALYGSQASNGAIVITTKKARGTSGKVLVNYDNNFRLQKITRFAQINNDYGPGFSNGIPTPPPLSGEFRSFGPVWKDGTPLYDNLHHFFRTGFSQTHNLGLEFGSKNVGFRASGQYFDSKGIIPNNTYTKYNFKISNNTKIGKYITITPSLAYTNSKNVKPLKGTSSSGGYLLDLYSWPANNDIRNYQNANGGKILVFNTNYNTDFDNPFWSAKNNISGDKTERLISTLGIDVTPLSWLSLSGRFGYDIYKTDGYLFEHPQSYILSASTAGSLDNYYRRYKGYNHTITATAKKKIGDFSTRLLVGTMWQDYETQQTSVVGTHLVDSATSNGALYKNGAIISNLNPWDSSISLPGSRTRLLRNYFGLPNLNILRELAYFGEVSVGFKDVAFLTYSHRFETASPLPAANRNYHFPGASLSLIVSDIFPRALKGNVLNYWKIRGSLANTARLNDPYSNQRVFVNNQSSSVIPGYTYGFTVANEFLRPERQKTYEIGTELRFIDNLASLEMAYYNTLCTDQIAQGYRASYATGGVLNTANAASLRNEGLELTLNLNPIQKRDFSWNITFNFNHMWSKVLALPESIGLLNDFYNSDTYISNVRGGLIRGHSTGTITGSTYTRNYAGQIIISSTTGLPVITAGNSLIGDRTPEFTLGTLNSFRYKNWSLNFLWDLREGGDIYNGTDQVLTSLGKSARTAKRTTPIVVNGVLNDGLQNTANPTPNNIVVTPY
ncbi:MAG: SusC/RagA family TonB-linked outer membrane protein, partial [Bacteroidota bacterium]|nr:SusC/RagA family TonB-linked outer membrane protein [Bacteroidota bacterium]